MRRPALRVRWSLVGLLLCCCSFSAAVASAQVDPAPYEPPESVFTEPTIDPELAECPEPPEPLDSAEAEYSEELVELRLLRIQADRTCIALAERSDLIAKRVWWAVVEAAEGRGQRAITNSKLTELVEASCAKPCPVAIATDELGEGQTAELVSSIDSSGEATKVGLYFLAGLVVAGVIAFAIYRTVERA